MSMNEKAFDPAPPSPSEAEIAAEGPSGLIKPTKTEYHIHEPEFMMGPWAKAPNVDFSSMTENTNPEFLMGL